MRAEARDHGWLAALLLGVALAGLELLRIGLLPERYVEWWASSWMLAPVGMMGFAALVVIARTPRITALEAAAAMFAINAPMIAAFVIASLSTDGMAGTSEYPTAWVRGYGCTPPVAPVGGRVTGTTLALGLSMIAAVGVLPARSPGRVALHALLPTLVFGGAAVCVWSTRASAAYVGFAFALSAWGMSWGAPHWRSMLSRAFAALAFALTILWDTLIEISTIRGASGPMLGGEREDIVHAAQVFAQIEAPLPAFIWPAAILLAASLAPLVRRPRAMPTSGSSVTWLAVGAAAVLVGCAAHFHAEKETFHAQLRHAERHRFTHHWPEYLPSVKGDSPDEARVSSLLFVPHLEQPASVIEVGPDGRVEQHPTGERVRVIVSEENTAESVARALFKRRSESGAFELVLATEGAP